MLERLPKGVSVVGMSVHACKGAVCLLLASNPCLYTSLCHMHSSRYHCT